MSGARAERPPYVLATGRAAVERLRAVNDVHGADSARLLRRAGLRSGMHVADIGCGCGLVACSMARRVGPTGSVTAIDISEGQVEQARHMAARRRLGNVRFAVAGAHDTGLPRQSFDLVFSRFVLMHVQRPQAALEEMASLVRPGGVLVVEDGDFSEPFCEPPTYGFDRVFELYRALGETRGLDFRIGPKLYRMCLAAGLEQIEVAIAQPVFVRGLPKRLPQWTLEECIDALEAAGLADRPEVELLITEMDGLARDDTVMFGMARMTQVLGRKPVLRQ
ncbi:MAG TPA: methyltransferase domain-containing protein [Chthonomonadales bacterium]|nr:methyltransferase domain-containing protein [Chthonomonadales bacterium]